MAAQTPLLKVCLGWTFKMAEGGFPGGAVVGSLPADAGDTGSCPGLGGFHMLRSGWAREPWPLSLHMSGACAPQQERPQQ